MYSKHFIGIILFALFHTFALTAQERIVFDENFDTNFWNWTQGNNNDYSAELRDGKYYLAYKQVQEYWCFWQPIPVSPDTLFYIESKISILSETGSYGIIWGVKDSRNFNAFLVNSFGNCAVAICQNGQLIEVAKWTAIDGFNIKEAQVIGIRQKSGYLQYSINEKIILTSPVLKFRGGLMGFVLAGNTQIAVDYLKAQQDRAINLVDNPLQGTQRINLGANVNSTFSELHPLIAHDGQSLFLTRKGHPDNIGGEQRDDAWMAKKSTTGDWEKIQNLGFPINNSDHNQVIAVSADNNTLLLGNTYLPNGAPKDKGISISFKKEDGSWEIPQEVFIENFYNYNPLYSAYLAAGNQILLLSLERQDSYGYLDLYVSFLQANGNFSTPLNLGATINTLHEDSSPFLAADGKTLYFASNGHGGYGSTDIFVTRRLDESWQNWSVPQNLGSEINTERWEGYYSIDASGKTAYLSSSKGLGHIGAEDVYKIIPPSSSKPNPILFVKGKVFDAKTKNPLYSQIFYYDFIRNQQLGSALSNNKDGSYQIALPPDNQYSFLSFKNGYYPASEKIDIGKITAYTEREVNLYLHPIEIGETIPLNNVFFNENSDDLSKESGIELERLAFYMLEKHPEMTIELESKSTAKAEKIKEYLIKKGIDGQRIVPSNTLSKNSKNSFTITSLDQDKNLVRKGNFDEVKDTIAKIQQGQIFRLNHTLFDADSTNITPTATKELLQLKDFLEKNPSITIEIGGHTNGLPEHDYCDRLSTARAKNVAQFLVSQGIPSHRIQYKGYGKRQPIATNDTLKGRQLNQRVEVKVLKSGGQ